MHWNQLFMILTPSTNLFLSFFKIYQKLLTVSILTCLIWLCNVSGFTKLVLNLFTNRPNRMITANGLLDPYKVKIGIDQGEVISPLLWVIYIDPLLVILNNNNSSSYTISFTSTRSQVNTLTLIFMNNITLIF